MLRVSFSGEQVSEPPEPDLPSPQLQPDESLLWGEETEGLRPAKSPRGDLLSPERRKKETQLFPIPRGPPFLGGSPTGMWSV